MTSRFSFVLRWPIKREASPPTRRKALYAFRYPAPSQISMLISGGKLMIDDAKMSDAQWSAHEMSVWWVLCQSRNGNFRRVLLRLFSHIHGRGIKFHASLQMVDIEHSGTFHLRIEKHQLWIESTRSKGLSSNCAFVRELYGRRQIVTVEPRGRPTIDTVISHSRSGNTADSVISTRSRFQSWHKTVKESKLFKLLRKSYEHENETARRWGLVRSVEEIPHDTMRNIGTQLLPWFEDCLAS